MFLLISWRWVRNVVAVIASTRNAAVTMTATSPSAFRKVSESGTTPNSLAVAELLGLLWVMHALRRRRSTRG